MLDHSEWVLVLGADMSLGRFGQILQLALSCIRQGTAFAELR